ncbi:hypothetical protein TWF281_010343 [Arthrobotrys megalospora]
MKTPYLVPILYGTVGLSFRVDIQWGTGNPLTLDLRSFQPESELWNKTAPRFQESFTIDTDRTHNRMAKACKEITQPYTQIKDREDRDYLRRYAYVKAVRISQTPQTIPPNDQWPPFTHPYPRSARGVAFFGNGNCKGEPKLIIWPKQAADMNYPTTKRFEILRSPTEVENFYYKWAQTFEFSEFDLKKDPNSHYNVARPQLQYILDPIDPKQLADQKEKYPETAYLKKGTLGSPMGTPYHQPFGSFREIFPTRSDRVWRQIVSPSEGDTSYWNIPMINVQLDHRNSKGAQKNNFFRSFVPYGLLDSSWATVFELIEQEYARFYKLIVDLLGVPGKSPVKRIRWSTKRQAAALKTLASVSDPLSTFHAETVKSLERIPNDNALSSLPKFEIYTTSPTDPSSEEWTLPPSWEQVPVWNPKIGRLVKNLTTGLIEPSGAYQKDPNPNRILYSSVQLDWQPDGQFTVTTVPVVSDPTATLEKEAILEQLPLVEAPSEPVVEIPIVNIEQPPIKINTGADLRTAAGIEEEKVEVEQIDKVPGIPSPLLSPAGSPSSRENFNFDDDNYYNDPSQQSMPVDISEVGTAGSLSELAQSVVDEASGIYLNEGYGIVAPYLGIEQGRQDEDLKASLIVTRPRSRGGVSGERPQLQVESLSGSEVSYRPQDDPLLQSQSSLRQSRGGRVAPNSIEILRESVVSYRPPPAQNLRKNLLAASQHPNVNGDIVVPVGDNLAHSIVINSRRQLGQNRPVPAAVSKSSGTGKKGECIPRPSEQRVAAGVCSALACCS